MNADTDTAADATITLTRAEYEALMAPPRRTIEVDVEEYEALKARTPADADYVEQLRGQLVLAQARMRELEGIVKREQMEHAEEYNALLRAYQRLGGIRS